MLQLKIDSYGNVINSGFKDVVFIEKQVFVIGKMLINFVENNKNSKIYIEIFAYVIYKIVYIPFQCYNHPGCKLTKSLIHAL